MIAFLEGTVEYTTLDQIVLQVQGVGFLVWVPPSLAMTAEEGQRMRIYTHLHVREDALLLYGFATREEKELFVRLQSVSGIGPKAALAIAAAAPVETICAAIQGENIAFLTKLPGVGKKTAQRLVIDLKDKLNDLHGISAHSPVSNAAPAGVTSQEEVIAALLALGYTEKEAQGAVRTLAREMEQGASVETMIRLALRELARK